MVKVKCSRANGDDCDKEKEVKPEKVNTNCDSCGKGVMEQTDVKSAGKTAPAQS